MVKPQIRNPEHVPFPLGELGFRLERRGQIFVEQLQRIRGALRPYVTPF